MLSLLVRTYEHYLIYWQFLHIGLPISRYYAIPIPSIVLTLENTDYNNRTDPALLCTLYKYTVNYNRILCYEDIARCSETLRKWEPLKKRPSTVQERENIKIKKCIIFDSSPLCNHLECRALHLWRLETNFSFRWRVITLKSATSPLYSFLLFLVQYPFHCKAFLPCPLYAHPPSNPMSPYSRLSTKSFNTNANVSFIRFFSGVREDSGHDIWAPSFCEWECSSYMERRAACLHAEKLTNSSLPFSSRCVIYRHFILDSVEYISLLVTWSKCIRTFD